MTTLEEIAKIWPDDGGYYECKHISEMLAQAGSKKSPETVKNWVRTLYDQGYLDIQKTVRRGTNVNRYRRRHCIFDYVRRKEADLKRKINGPAPFDESIVAERQWRALRAMSR